MMPYHVLKPICLILAVAALVFGLVGMALSFLAMMSQNSTDVIAGAAGFVAGAIFLAAGLLSLTVLSLARTTATIAKSPERELFEASA